MREKHKTAAAKPEVVESHALELTDRHKISTAKHVRPHFRDHQNQQTTRRHPPITSIDIGSEELCKIICDLDMQLPFWWHHFVVRIANDFKECLR